jgi:hypothetical protein
MRGMVGRFGPEAGVRRKADVVNVFQEFDREDCLAVIDNPDPGFVSPEDAAALREPLPLACDLQLASVDVSAARRDSASSHPVEEFFLKVQPGAVGRGSSGTGGRFQIDAHSLVFFIAGACLRVRM